MKSTKIPVVAIFLAFLNAGCAEMAVLTGAALTGAGVANSDVETAALGGLIYETGMQQMADEDVDLEKSLGAGILIGTGVDTGDGELVLSALARGATASVESSLQNAAFGSSLNTIETFDASTTSSSAASCEPIPASCMQAGQRATQFMERIEAGGIAGIVDGASKMACATKVGIEVNSYCATVYAAEGKGHCATLMKQQVEALRETLRSAEAAAGAAAVSGVRNKCSFE
jgi:hypothetical protein